MRWLNSNSLLPLLLALLLLGAVGCRDNPVETTTDEAARVAPADLSDDLGFEDETLDGAPVVELADAEAYFEFNTTDNDLGLQIFLDGEGWDKMKVFDPDRDLIVSLMAKGNLADLGITELRFESAEPSPGEVLAKFPPGPYRFRGRSVEGDRLVGESELSHDFAAAPTFSPSGGETVDPEEVTVEWDAPGAELLEVILESDASDAVFDVIVEADVESLDIPEQFFEPNTEYKIEVLAISENGNKTITESTFFTMP